MGNKKNTGKGKGKSSKTDIANRMEALVQIEAACLDKGDVEGWRKARAERNQLEAKLTKMADKDRVRTILALAMPKLSVQDRAALMTMIKAAQAKVKGRDAKVKAGLQVIQEFAKIGQNSRIDYEALAKEAAGNWRKFESFGWSRYSEEGSENWAIVYTHNRDSGIIDESNAAVLAREFAPFLGEDDADIQEEYHGHWACGWVAGYSIRVYGANGQITTAFKLWCEFAHALEDYPILDESDVSEREWEAASALVEAGCYDNMDEALEHIHD